MSGKIMGGVWDLDLPRIQSFVLLAMADHADHDGRNVHPGVALIVWKTGLSERAVQTAIAELTELGILVPVSDNIGGRGNVARYEIDLSKGILKEPLPQPKRVQTVRGLDKKKGAGDAPINSLKGANYDIKGANYDNSHIVDRAGVLTVIEPSVLICGDDTTEPILETPESEPEKEPETQAVRGFVKPETHEVEEYLRSLKERPKWTDRIPDAVEMAESFVDYNLQRNWIPNGSSRQMTDWKAAIRTYLRFGAKYNTAGQLAPPVVIETRPYVPTYERAKVSH